MRVVHFSDTYLPRRDGVVTSILTLAEALAPRGHSSTLFAPRYPGSQGGPGLALQPLPSLPSGVAGIRLAAWPRGRHVARDRAPLVDPGLSRAGDGAGPAGASSSSSRRSRGRTCGRRVRP